MLYPSTGHQVWILILNFPFRIEARIASYSHQFYRFFSDPFFADQEYCTILLFKKIPSVYGRGSGEQANMSHLLNIRSK